MTDDLKKLSKSKMGAAAIGSAAIAAALIFAGRHSMRKLDDFRSTRLPKGKRYESEPLDEDEEDYGA